MELVSLSNSAQSVWSVSCSGQNWSATIAAGLCAFLFSRRTGPLHRPALPHGLRQTLAAGGAHASLFCSRNFCWSWTCRRHALSRSLRSPPFLKCSDEPFLSGRRHAAFALGASSRTCLFDFYTGPVAIASFNPAQGFQCLLDSRLAALQACNDIFN